MEPPSRIGGGQPSVDCYFGIEYPRNSAQGLAVTRGHRNGARSYGFMNPDTVEEKNLNRILNSGFNSSTSMSRLTLNILLSFAQFEREIIGERTRDKLSAARRKGKWIGGIPGLGYDVAPQGGRLVVNPAKAEQVHEIFSLCATCSTVTEALLAVRARRWTAKQWTSERGKQHGGQRLSMSTLQLMLTNVLIGETSRTKAHRTRRAHRDCSARLMARGEPEAETQSYSRSVAHQNRNITRGSLDMCAMRKLAEDQLHSTSGPKASLLCLQGREEADTGLPAAAGRLP